MQKTRYNSGQILLVVVLSIVVALTVGLSIAARTISNVKISQQNEESQKAFQAAEAGIEKALQKLNCAGSSCTINTNFTESDSSVVAQITSSDANPSINLNNGNDVPQAVGIDVFLSNYDPNSNTYSTPFYSSPVRIYWGAGTSCSGTGPQKAPALEVLLLYGPTSNPQLYREVIDPCGTGRTPGAKNANAGGAIGTINYPYSTVFPSSGAVASSPKILMKVIPFYNSSKIGIAKISGPDLPAQGVTIESTGKAGDSERKIVYTQPYPQIPNELFEYAIISQ